MSCLLKLLLFFLPILAIAIDKNELLKDFLTPEQLKRLEQSVNPSDNSKPKPTTNGKSKTKADKDIIWKSGFKSEIKLNCVEKKFKKFQFQVKIENLDKWLKDCRSPKINKCKVSKSLPDKVCFARAQSYYEFVMTQKQEDQIQQRCSRKELTCPVKKADQPQIKTNILKNPKKL